jgi:hypothetical protein
MIEFLTASFAIGFLGSLHCVGMCGGLISAMGMTRPQTWWPGVIAYQIGRITTYTTLGFIIGLIGSLLHSSSWLGGIQNIISIIAGIIIILLALHIGGWLPDPFSRFSKRIMTITGFSRFITAAAMTDNTAPWYSAGLINGLLPCGLVYAAITLSLTATTVGQGVAGMLLFGLGTVPAMLAVPALMRAVTPAARGRILKIGAVLLISVGAITLARGTPLGQQMHGEHNGGAAHEHHSSNPLQELEADSYCVIPAEQAIEAPLQQPSGAAQ